MVSILSSSMPTRSPSPRSKRRRRIGDGRIMLTATTASATKATMNALITLGLALLLGRTTNSASAFLATTTTTRTAGRTKTPSSLSKIMTTATSTCFITNKNQKNVQTSRRRTTARFAVEVGTSNHHHQQQPRSSSNIVVGGGSGDKIDDNHPASLFHQSQDHQREILFSVGPAIHSLQTKLMYKEHTPGGGSSSPGQTSSTSSSTLLSSAASSTSSDTNLPVVADVDDGQLTVQQKAINLLFLSAAFGYAIYTIINIDHGMTRGWSATEIAMRIPLDNWGAYESYLANKPIVTKTLINVIIYLLGDWLSQTAFQGKNVLDFDISRTLRNGFIGLCFGPLVHQYYEFSDAILPPENGLVTRLEKIVMDQTIYLTVKCSVYISAVGLLAGEEWPTVKQTVQDKIQGVVFTAWKFWPIVHCITYSLIPAQHRILWVNCVDLVWNGLLASMAQKKSSVFEELDDAEDEENMKVLSAFEVAAFVVNDPEVEVVADGEKPDLVNGGHSAGLLEMKEEKTLVIVNDTTSVDFSPAFNSTSTSTETISA